MCKVVKSNGLIIKRETKRKKKPPTAIGNMTSSSTIILNYDQHELFIKLFHNGKFQVNGNCSKNLAIVRNAIEYILYELAKVAEKYYSDL